MIAMTPVTKPNRVTKSRRAAIAAGAVAVPYTVLRDPVAIAALASLREHHGTIRAALEHALRHAEKTPVSG